MVITCGRLLLSLMSGLAWILAATLSGLNSDSGMGPMMPRLFRVGCRKIGIVPVMMIECSTDLWQLRSTSTTSPLPTLECQTILFEVDVPFVTKNRWSQLKMRAALRSDAATG